MEGMPKTHGLILRLHDLLFAGGKGVGMGGTQLFQSLERVYFRWQDTQKVLCRSFRIVKRVGMTDLDLKVFKLLFGIVELLHPAAKGEFP